MHTTVSMQIADQPKPEVGPTQGPRACLLWPDKKRVFPRLTENQGGWIVWGGKVRPVDFFMLLFQNTWARPLPSSC